MHIVLVEPEIPQNTGNIVRTCAATDSTLHLVRPLGFSTEDKYLKRAGLDYWDKVNIYYYNSIQEVLNKYKDNNFYFSSSKSAIRYDKIQYTEKDLLFFGKETEGLPDSLLKKYPDKSIRIPMSKNIRCLNLANSVSIILYEALRQLNFLDLSKKGKYGNLVD
ncbi:MAG: tRNA (uridine(34)/cytosine(34)/5-carboxymethylaminomethyluridine(34)-2'-O)-methyltransferase TrmL [Halanaerobiaceae bacterium]